MDVNAGIHGNWTMENAKSMLHQWLQTNHIKCDYTYSTVGPDHNRSFVAEMGFFVNKLNRKIQARETASNKQMASKSCALSLVRQLFHFGVIEAFSGITYGRMVQANFNVIHFISVERDRTVAKNLFKVHQRLFGFWFWVKQRTISFAYLLCICHSFYFLRHTEEEQGR